MRLMYRIKAVFYKLLRRDRNGFRISFPSSSTGLHDLRCMSLAHGRLGGGSRLGFGSSLTAVGGHARYCQEWSTDHGFMTQGLEPLSLRSICIRFMGCFLATINFIEYVSWSEDPGLGMVLQ